MKYSAFIISLITALVTAACQKPSEKPTPREGAAFLSQLQAHCGKAYPGKVISTDAADEDWRQESLTMHVRDCSGGEIKIALHVGENRSRTWILRYEDDHLALRHDHRHEDGTADALTFYGGHAAGIGSKRISFPADQSTKDLFDRENIPVSKENIWAIELSADNQSFTYEMRRPNRDFRAEFDLSAPVDIPPVPWGW